MSARGRGPYNGGKHSFYETPAWATEALVRALPAAFTENGLRVLDAGCGTGAIGRELKRLTEHWTIEGVELDSKHVEVAKKGGSYAKVHQGTFFNVLTQKDAVVMNPPFPDAQRFIEHSLRLVASNRDAGFGFVAALLRLNWMASKSRVEFHRKHPAHIVALSKRPSFDGPKGRLVPKKTKTGRVVRKNGKIVLVRRKTTDATDYGWFIWGDGKEGRWDVADPPPKERKETMAAKKKAAKKSAAKTKSPRKSLKSVGKRAKKATTEE